MSDIDLSTCTCIDGDPVRCLPEPEPEHPDDYADWYAEDIEPEWPDDPPCPYRVTDWYADECWSGNCTLAAQELAEAIEARPEVHPERQHPNGYGLRWEVGRLWHLVLHWVR